ncbi:MAG: DUF2818 family protein [Aquabacterium sp.]|uniref:DUF2818 family protein n=1 Tax=Aquabacterium sp. TaxID=1872578 RepID=UPI00271B4413|nr:DUF2818 family protein [Aquabacterium sp.]MDO9002692.1 DUF2818 family protein [Aquabacterium sp.]
MGGLIPVWAVVAVLLVAMLAANAPFLNNRLFLLGPTRVPKSLFVRLLELLVYASLVFGLGRALEAQLGQTSPQRWEFYAVGALTFLTLAFPGFVWRYLRRNAVH